MAKKKRNGKGFSGQKSPSEVASQADEVEQESHVTGTTKQVDQADIDDVEQLDDVENAADVARTPQRTGNSSQQPHAQGRAQPPPVVEGENRPEQAHPPPAAVHQEEQQEGDLDGEAMHNGGNKRPP